MHYAYQSSGDDLTRRLLLLQNAAFLTLFRGALGGAARRARHGSISSSRPRPRRRRTARRRSRPSSPRAATRPPRRTALAYLQAGHEAEPLIQAARRLVFLKGDDAHDYKFSSAVLEDYYHASPSFRERYLAASTLLLPAASDRDNNLVKRIRAAFA